MISSVHAVRVGHGFAEAIQILTDHRDSDSGSLFNGCVESTILGSWQYMEVTVMDIVVMVVMVRLVVVVEICISIKFQVELAILDICVLFLEDRALFFPCYAID